MRVVRLGGSVIKCLAVLQAVRCTEEVWEREEQFSSVCKAASNALGKWAMQKRGETLGFFF